MILITFCTPLLNLTLTWIKKYDITCKDPIFLILNQLKTKKKLYFTTLNYTPDYTLHHKLLISIQVNVKLNVEV